MDERLDAQAAQRGERRAGGAVRALDHRVHRTDRALAHPGEQIRLVAEMPVDGAARHAGLGRDLGERRARDAAVAEHALGGVEQLFARRGGFLAGSARHGCDPSILVARHGRGSDDEVRTPPVVANIHECM